MADPVTLPSVYLKRVDGSVASYSAAECERILGHLAASGVAGTAQTTSNGSEIFFWAASPYLLIADLGWQVGRRMSEMFVVAVDVDQPLGLRFQSDEGYYDLQTALQMAGWSGGGVLDPIALLEQVHMTMYRSPLDLGQYATNAGTEEDGVPLVVFGGVNNRPAEILRL